VESAHSELWATVTSVYDAFLAGDRAAVDRTIAPDATIWDAYDEPLIRGRAQLDALRAARPTDAPRPAALDAVEPVIDVHGDIGVVRHLLVVRWPEGSGLDEQRIRNTSVWKRRDGRWQCVHNHEDLLG
jgi:ketosteroid isomerase-like protein